MVENPACKNGQLDENPPLFCSPPLKPIPRQMNPIHASVPEIQFHYYHHPKYA
jgi:hypothetical protein